MFNMTHPSLRGEHLHSSHSKQDIHPLTPSRNKTTVTFWYNHKDKINEFLKTESLLKISTTCSLSYGMSIARSKAGSPQSAI